MNQDYLSQADWDLIQEIDRKFPDKTIMANFKRYLALPPEKRVAQGQDDLKTILRAGWKIRGIPDTDVETLEEHVQGMKNLAMDYIATHKSIDAILQIIEAHDAGEIIIGDFIPGHAIPRDNIDKQDKEAVEFLAIRVIYEARPDIIESYIDYANRRTMEGQIVKDLDKAQMFLRAKQYNATHPDIDLSEFNLDGQNYDWLTQEGLTIFYQAMRKLS